MDVNLKYQSHMYMRHKLCRHHACRWPGTLGARPSACTVTTEKLDIFSSKFPWLAINDDVIKWKHFPCYWSFVQGIHQSSVNSPKKRPVMWSFDVFFDMHLNSKRLRYWWFQTPSHLLWRHCNVCHITFVDQMMSSKMSDMISRNLTTLWSLKMFMPGHIPILGT